MRTKIKCNIHSNASKDQYAKLIFKLEFKYIIISLSCYCGLSTVSLLDAAWGRQTLDDLLVENQTLTKK